MTIPTRTSGRLPGRVGALTLLAAALGWGPAFAYRPFDFTDADVVGRHKIEIEVGPFEYVTTGAERWARAPVLVLNYGVGAGYEVVIEGMNLVPLEAEPGAEARWEDVALSVKKVLRRGALQDAGGPSVATEETVVLPPEGSPHAGFSANAILSSASDDGVAHFNLEVGRSTEGRNGVAGALILEVGDVRAVTPVLELSVEAEDGEAPEQAALVGLLYVARENLELDLALREGWSGAENVTEVRAGLTWVFAGHDVLKGVHRILRQPRRGRH